MGWSYLFAASGAACAGIVVYAIYKKMKEDDNNNKIEVFETKRLEIDDLKSWIQQNSFSRPIGIYLIYGSKGRLAVEGSQDKNQILEYLKKNTKVFSRFDDFIVQLVFNENTSTVEKYRIITFQDLAKDLNDTLEKYHFFSSGIIKLT